MTTNFALSLSFAGIQLLHRVTGGWQVVGDADVEARDLDAVLADLRKKALALEPGGLRTKIVIPLDQIKYMALDTTRTTQDDIDAALDGATPYALDELVIDCERRGGRTHIAAVARETLDEAEAFARAHRFNPVACVAIPEPFTFQSEVFFGPTSMMPEVLGPSGTVERDILPIMVVGTRIKSRLLIFDIPEDELPPSDGADLATLLAPHADPVAEPAAPPPAVEILPPVVEAVAPEVVEVPDRGEVEDPDPTEVEGPEPTEAEAPEPLEDENPEPVVVADVEPATTEEQSTAEDMLPQVPDLIEVTAAETVDDETVDDEMAPAAEDDPVSQTDTPLDTVAEADLFSIPAETEPQPSTDKVPDPHPEPADAPDEPTDAPAPELSDTEVETSTGQPADDDALQPVTPVPETAVLPVSRAPAYPMMIDPVIAEYHTARPKYKRRARRRMIGSITAVAPASGAPEIAAPVKAPVAPTPPTRARVTPAAPARHKKVLVGTAIAASFALAGLLAWSQLAPETTDAPDEVQSEPAATAEVIDSADISPPAPAPAVQNLETAPSDTPPAVVMLDVLRQTPPVAVSANAPVVTAIVRHDPLRTTPRLEIGLPDTAVPPVAPMPAPAESAETAQAQVGAPVLRGRVLSPDEAARIYAATGVWQRAPRIIDVPGSTTTDGIIWPDITTAPDKVAQPIVPQADTLTPELTFVAPADPPPPETTFDLDENGDVLATTQGAVTPEGAVVFAGLPDVNVRLRPELTADDLARMALLAPAVEGVVIVAGAPDVIPPTRPATAALPVDDAPTAGAVGLAGLQPDGAGSPLVDTQASALTAAIPALGPRPQARPAGLSPPPPPADLPSNPDITSVIAGIAEEAAATPFIDMTPRAVGASRRPVTRPGNFATVVANARAQIASQQAAAAAAPAPQRAATPQPASAPVNIPRNTTPAPGGVARAATQDDAIALREINLIGVYGRPNNRRALVRLPNGSFVRVEIGSALDGGQVTAIGDNALNYVKRGRTYALQVPG